MSFRSLLGSTTATAALFLSLWAAPAIAAAPTGGAQGQAAEESDLVGLGFGPFDFVRTKTDARAIDMRLDYRWGISLLPALSEALRPVDAIVRIHPYVGLEGTEKGQIYGVGGFAFDFQLGNHLVLSPTLAFGLYGKGRGKNLGAIPEFRSTLEAGWKFDNQIRAVGYVSHISNAGISEKNPGAEMAGIMFQVPTALLF